MRRFCFTITPYMLRKVFCVKITCWSFYIVSVSQCCCILSDQPPAADCWSAASAGVWWRQARRQWVSDVSEGYTAAAAALVTTNTTAILHSPHPAITDTPPPTPTPTTNRENGKILKRWSWLQAWRFWSSAWYTPAMCLSIHSLHHKQSHICCQLTVC